MQRLEAAPEADAGNLCQPISAMAVQQQVALSPRGPVATGHLDPYPDLRTRATEHYRQNQEAPLSRFNSLTSSLTPPCFGHAVITHPFPQPFIMRGVEKYSGNTKPDHWLNDYLTAIEMANGDISNALRQIPLCLPGHARSWLSGLPRNSITPGPTSSMPSSTTLRAHTSAQGAVLTSTASYMATTSPFMTLLHDGSRREIL